MDAASRPRRTGDPTASREQHSTDHVGRISRPSPRPSDRVPRRRPTDAVRRRVRWTLSNPASDAVQATSHPRDAASRLGFAGTIADPSDDQRQAIEGRSDAGSDAVHRNEGPRAHRTAPMTSDGGGEIARPWGAVGQHGELGAALGLGENVCDSLLSGPKVQMPQHKTRAGTTPSRTESAGKQGLGRAGGKSLGEGVVMVPVAL